MAQRITKRVVDQLEATDRDTFVWDSEIKGFGVRCRPSGAKYYVVKMRVGSRQRWITIGRHGSPLTPDSARTEALKLIGLKVSGIDPAADRDGRRGAITVSGLGERFLSEYVLQRCKPTTASEYHRAVEQFINPALGRHRLTDLTRADVAKLHHDMRSKPYMANRVMATLSKMLNLAEQWGLRPDGSNPTRYVEKYRETSRERYLTREELQRLGRTIADAEADGSESRFVLAAIMLLILTGARLSEVLTLQWEHVDVENAMLRLPDSKTGAKRVHLNDAALAVLRQLPRMMDNPHVIPGYRDGARLINLQKPWRRIRAKAGLDDVRIHDLRHSFASVAAGAGLSLPMIGNLLGHSQPATTHRYAHLAADPTRAAADLVGAEITRAMSAKPRRHRVRLEEVEARDN